ncbi:MAG: hypothetical protein D6750_00905 [Bacteroidetes bacterium]|nr:MAG: hypothetical protein D6750_00905 [Bacteroidota bacterium]
MRQVSWIALTLVWAQGFPEYELPIQGWEALQRGSVQVWYLRGQESLAQQVSAWSADAFQEITGLLEFQPEGVLTVRLHPSPRAWAQQPLPTPQGSLTPPSRIVEVFPAASRAAFAAQVRSRIIATVLEHLYFSEGMRFQNRTLLYMPDWFWWGFAYFWGEGWTGEDIAWLQQLPPTAFTLIARRQPPRSPFYRSLYKSIWFYLYRTYGQRKVIDLLYMARLTRNISEALALTLNLSEEELTQKWKAFIESLKQEPALPIDESFSSPVLAAAVHTNQVAYAAYRKGAIRYFLQLDGQSYELPGAWPWKNAYEEPQVPLAFSAGGRLAWVAYQTEGPVLWVWDPEKRRYDRYPVEVRAVHSLAWEQEGILWLSALTDAGEVALFTFSYPQGSLRKAFTAKGDLLWPLPRPQGEVWALWQPDTSVLQPLSVVWEPPRPVRCRSGQCEPLPFPSLYAALGGWLPADSGAFTLCDAYGQGHPWWIAPDTNQPASGFVPGLYSWVGRTGDTVFFLYAARGRWRLGSLPAPTIAPRSEVFPPISAAEVIQFRLQRKGRYTSTYAVARPLPAQDTTQKDTPRAERQPFYLFDEESERPRRRRSRPKIVPQEARTPALPTARPLGKVPFHLLLADLRMGPTLHPLMRLGWRTELALQDHQGNHRFRLEWTPYIDLRSSQLQLSYTAYRYRLQPVAELIKQSHFFSEQRYGRTLRNTTWQGVAGVRWVLTPSLAVEATVLGLQAHRYDLQNTDQLDLSAHTFWTGGRFRFLIDRVSYREWFPWEGWKLQLRTETYRHGAQWGFPLVSLQGTRFQPIGRLLMLQLNGHAAWGGLQGRYFLLGGVSDWVNYEYLNRSQIPPLGPAGAYYLAEYAYLPGFPYHARRGRNLLLGSVVARIPLLAWQNSESLPTRPLYGFEWQIGYYIGTTWTTGNPFSQKNPIDAEYIFKPPLVISVQTLKSPFLMSVGTGLTFRIMQLPIGVEVYWPIEEARADKPRFLLSFKQDL